MTSRRGRRRAPPAPPPGGVLDWRDAAHWSWNPKPCRYCDKPTHLRDSRRSPAHKVCAEEALAIQAADAADAYQNGTL
ncbi:hypothetical protein [Streptomyces sp. NPDC016845]|uniref:hypothetical protein n=1 Tax=Streptomyces sp. NPDC016845 TaxID=3364972 RepID=UPI0037A5BD5A